MVWLRPICRAIYPSFTVGHPYLQISLYGVAMSKLGCFTRAGFNSKSTNTRSFHNTVHPSLKQRSILVFLIIYAEMLSPCVIPQAVKIGLCFSDNLTMLRAAYSHIRFQIEIIQVAAGKVCRTQCRGIARHACHTSVWVCLLGVIRRRPDDWECCLWSYFQWWLERSYGISVAGWVY